MIKKKKSPIWTEDHEIHQSSNVNFAVIK